MPRARCLWVFVAGAHLGIVLCGACQWLPHDSNGRLAQLLRWYARMSGANTQYGFYAPEVGEEYRARFVLQDHEGVVWTDTFQEANSPEARLRLVGIAQDIVSDGNEKDYCVRRSDLVKSWAAMMFSRHVSAVSLTVVVEIYKVPSMGAYRAGSRPGWEVVYQADFQRHAAAESRSEP